jgi:hypothetical protein
MLGTNQPQKQIRKHNVKEKQRARGATLQILSNRARTACHLLCCVLVCTLVIAFVVCSGISVLYPQNRDRTFAAGRDHRDSSLCKPRAKLQVQVISLSFTGKLAPQPETQNLPVTELDCRGRGGATQVPEPGPRTAGKSIRNSSSARARLEL